MHPSLTASLARLRDHFSHDPRCVGVYLSGSLAHGTADAESDVDLGVVVRDADYPALKAEIRSACEAECGPIVAWLREGESAGSVNYAFLFTSGEDVLLYDLAILTESAVASSRAPLRGGQILFDRTGRLADFTTVAPAQSPAAEALPHAIQDYWVYAYLNGKYWRRRDLFKLLYVQQALLQRHLALLRLLYPESDRGWWARDVRHLPEVVRQKLLTYFGADSMETVESALSAELDFFSLTAREACRMADAEYPSGLEEAVRGHLRRSGIAVGTAAPDAR